jgi:hypothetical protein
MNKIDSERKVLQNLTPEDFLSFGLNRIAYIKPVSHDDRIVYSLHAADGQLLTTQETPEIVVMMAKDNHLAPVIVH